MKPHGFDIVMGHPREPITPTNFLVKAYRLYLRYKRQKPQKGSYYTPQDIIDYMSRNQ